MAKLAVNTLLNVILVTWVASAQTNEALDWVDYASVEYSILPNITYAIANGIDLKLDLYLPNKRVAPLPTVMLFHGGGWVEGQKERNVLQLLPYLSMGWAAVNVEYRLGRQSPAPAAVEDCRCALRWVYSHAKDYGFDPDRIVLTGGSAGGHLALITGLLPPGSRFDRSCRTDESVRWRQATEPEIKPAAIVSWYGITDVANLLEGPHAKHYAIEWFGSMENRLQLAQQLSPINYVRPGLPAIISIHGDQDDIAPYADVVALHKALDKANVPNQLITIRGAKHAGYSRQDMINSYAAIRTFLRKYNIIRDDADSH